MERAIRDGVNHGNTVALVQMKDNTLHLRYCTRNRWVQAQLLGSQKRQRGCLGP
jgi:hypothetical protein